MQADSRRQDVSPRRGSITAAESVRDSMVVARGMRLADISRRLRQLRPDAFAGGVELASIRDGRALFLAPSSAVAARVHQNQRQLRDLLHALDQPVAVVAVKVAQPRREPHATQNRKPLSAAAAEHLRQVAASLEDPALKAGLLELASLAR